MRASMDSGANRTPQVPEDLALILNDSSLFSNSAEITAKEILRRYGDRAKAPVVTVKSDTYGSASSPVSQTSHPYSGRDPIPVAQRIDTDPNMANAWQNESSVRHVGSDHALGTPPTLPYASGNPRSSSESHGSPNRSSMRTPDWDNRQRGKAVGMA